MKKTKTISWFLCIYALFLSTIFFIHRRLLPVNSDLPQTALVESSQREKEIVLSTGSIQQELVRNGTATSMSTPSLEMRENVDFLLTPGMLVQEAITEDAVLTYPEE